MPLSFEPCRDDSVGQVGNLRRIVNPPAGSKHNAGESPEKFALAAMWGSQSWLQPASRRNAAARIACPTINAEMPRVGQLSHLRTRACSVQNCVNATCLTASEERFRRQNSEAPKAVKHPVRVCLAQASALRENSPGSGRGDFPGT